MGPLTLSQLLCGFPLLKDKVSGGSLLSHEPSGAHKLQMTLEAIEGRYIVVGMRCPVGGHFHSTPTLMGIIFDFCTMHRVWGASPFVYMEGETQVSKSRSEHFPLKS